MKSRNSTFWCLSLFYLNSNKDYISASAVNLNLQIFISKGTEHLKFLSKNLLTLFKWSRMHFYSHSSTWISFLKSWIQSWTFAKHTTRKLAFNFNFPEADAEYCLYSRPDSNLSCVCCYETRPGSRERAFDKSCDKTWHDFAINFLSMMQRWIYYLEEA